jgi:hypothetical protein
LQLFVYLISGGFSRSKSISRNFFDPTALISRLAHQDRRPRFWSFSLQQGTTIGTGSGASFI